MSSKDFSDEWDRLNEKYAALQVALADSVVRAWSDDLVGALALDDMAFKDTARFMSLYNEASDMVKSFRYVANDYKTISILSNTAPGKMFLDYIARVNTSCSTTGHHGAVPARQRSLPYAKPTTHSRATGSTLSASPAATRGRIRSRLCPSWTCLGTRYLTRRKSLSNCTESRPSRT